MYLERYREWMETGKLPAAGLCKCFKLTKETGYHDVDLNLLMFRPTSLDFDKLLEDRQSIVYWASGLTFLSLTTEERAYLFTPLRQTIVLFMAALNNEL